MDLWDASLADMPLIAILRGLHPARAIEVADVLVQSGFRIIEVPLNSPNPLDSIERIAGQYSGDVIVGAGTVVDAASVSDVVNAGGQLIVSPNLNPEVGEKTIAQGAKWCPGVTTPTEAFAALAQGADLLKFFPAEIVSVSALAAMRAVLPANARCAVVGGITPEKMADYLNAGANGFGLGSALFKPEYSLDQLRTRADGFISAIGLYKSR